MLLIAASFADFNETNISDDSLTVVNKDLNLLNKNLDNSVWIKRFITKAEYTKFQNEQIQLDKKIKIYKKKRGKKAKKYLEQLLAKKINLDKQIQVLDQLGDNSYDSLFPIKEPQALPTISNPIEILIALNYIQNLRNEQLSHQNRLKDLAATVNLLQEKLVLLEQKVQFFKLDDDKTDFKLANTDLQQTKIIFNELDSIYKIFSTSKSLYDKKVSTYIIETHHNIEEQTDKLIDITIILVIFIIFLFSVKYMLKKAIKDTERFYIANKTINILGFFIILIFVAFNYINNITYLLTLLGFISAGLAFAMKDLFMSMLGWFVIVAGGYLHVGDRIRISRDNEEYLGDVLEITLTRITILEDVTLPSINVNRRAGRIVFIPNNFIFINTFQNYTFDGLRTVWDGIDIMITFDSNHQKAVSLSRQILSTYSKGYTDLTKKHILHLQSKYNLKNARLDPRVFTFAESYGIKISSWYLTNSYATLALRSTISAELIDAFNEAEDITLAYPTTTIRLNNQVLNLASQAGTISNS